MIFDYSSPFLLTVALVREGIAGCDGGLSRLALLQVVEPIFHRAKQRSRF